MDDEDDKALDRILDEIPTRKFDLGEEMEDKKTPGRVQADDGQGDDERGPREEGILRGVKKRTEAYSSYDEGASQSATKSSAASADSAGGSATGQDSAVNTSLEEAIQFAKRYLEDLLSFFGLNMDVYATTEDHEVIELDVPSTHLNGFLIGHNGDTVRALQYIVSSALKSQNYTHNRVNVDVADYKRQRAERLVKQAEVWFNEVRESGESKPLAAMNPAERRIIHQAATDYGLETESVGEGRERHIVLKPGAAAAEPEAAKPEEESPASEE